jgi:hypothetical protein
MSKQFFIPLKFSFQNAVPIIPNIQSSKHDDRSVWFENLGESLIESVSISIGGGKGYWCSKCNKLYHEKPCGNYRCKNMYTSYVLNKEKLSQLISELGDIDAKDDAIASSCRLNFPSGKIDDIYIQQYIEENKTSPAIEQIFREESQCRTDEEAQMDIVYENLMDLINERYSTRVYDKIVEECHNDNFVYGEKEGKIIDEQRSEYLSSWNKIK